MLTNSDSIGDTAQCHDLYSIPTKILLSYQTATRADEDAQWLAGLRRHPSAPYTCMPRRVPRLAPELLQTQAFDAECSLPQGLGSQPAPDGGAFAATQAPWRASADLAGAGQGPGAGPEPEAEDVQGAATAAPPTAAVQTPGPCAPAPGAAGPAQALAGPAVQGNPNRASSPDEEHGGKGGGDGEADALLRAAIARWPASARARVVHVAPSAAASSVGHEAAAAGGRGGVQVQAPSGAGHGAGGAAEGAPRAGGAVQVDRASVPQASEFLLLLCSCA